jgi:hypothetical protein
VAQRVRVATRDGVVGERARPALGLRGARHLQQFPGVGSGHTQVLELEVRWQQAWTGAFRGCGLHSYACEPRLPRQHKTNTSPATREDRRTEFVAGD